MEPLIKLVLRMHSELHCSGPFTFYSGQLSCPKLDLGLT